jgi:hypothetical protein
MDKLLTNKEFYEECEKRNIPNGYDIVLGWDLVEPQSFNNWLQMLINTYKELNEDLMNVVDLSDVELIKRNEELIKQLEEIC